MTLIDSEVTLSNFKLSYGPLMIFSNTTLSANHSRITSHIISAVKHLLHFDCTNYTEIMILFDRILNYLMTNGLVCAFRKKEEVEESFLVF